MVGVTLSYIAEHVPQLVASVFSAVAAGYARNIHITISNIHNTVKGADENDGSRDTLRAEIADTKTQMASQAHPPGE